MDNFLTEAGGIMDNSLIENREFNEICYKRQAHYYETDRMDVIHHSNYIRWFEEARIYYLEQIGFGYDKMESLGILSPVLSVSCEYKSSVRFHEEVLIYPKIEFFNGIKMAISYVVKDARTGKVRATGESKHCFVDSKFKPIRMKKDFNEIYTILSNCAAE